MTVKSVNYFLSVMKDADISLQFTELGRTMDSEHIAPSVRTCSAEL